MRRFFRDCGLTLALSTMFLVSLAGMMLSGQASFNKELIDHGAPALSLLSYLETGSFLSALFENWESEFLQMATYVVPTAILFQRGSSESRDPDDPHRPNDESPWHLRYPMAAWIYAHSLGLVLSLLFLASFGLHWWFGMLAANSEALLHGAAPETFGGYLLNPQLWFESFQNWQSEFLSTAVLVVLSIFLRHQGSPESKPVAAGNWESGD